CGYPMGPLNLLEFVGLDTTYKIAEIMFTEYREQRYAPPPLLKRMVLAGMNGRKTGKGFYDYAVDPPKVVDLGVQPVPRPPSPVPRPKDAHVRLRLAPLPRGGERPAGRAAVRDRAVRHRRLALEARIPQGRGPVDVVGRRERRVDRGNRRSPSRRRDRAWRGDPRADGDARDARAHHHGHLHRRPGVEAVSPRPPHPSRGSRATAAQRGGARDRGVDGRDRRQDGVRARSRRPHANDEGRDREPRGGARSRGGGGGARA